jgi:hypothetical protein
MLLVSDFYSQFNEPKPECDNKKKLANYIVAQLGESERYKFNLDHSYILEKRAKGLFSIYSNA